MKCIYDMKFIFLYNDNSLNLEDMKKFEEHLDSCERCKGILSRDKVLVDFLRKDESMGSTSFPKGKLMDSIPFGKYRKNPAKFRVLSLFNRILPSKATMAKATAAVILLALILNHQALVSNISGKMASIMKHNGSDYTNNLATTGTEKPRLTEGEPSVNSIVSEGSTNILVIGEDNSGIYDTIGVLSIDEKNKSLKIIMISGAVKVDYSSYVENKLPLKNVVGTVDTTKIKSAGIVGSQIGYEGRFNQGPASFISDVIKEKFGVYVDHYVKVELEGLRQIVDLFGGVDIDVPYNMDYDDPSRNLSIHLSKGEQHLDGKMAEYFLRYRGHHIFKDGIITDDIDGVSNNQAALIKAFIKQKITVSNVDKLPQLFNILDKEMEHSFDIKNNLSSYIKYLGNVSSDTYTIDTLVISDEG